MGLTQMEPQWHQGLTFITLSECVRGRVTKSGFKQKLGEERVKDETEGRAETLVSWGTHALL